MRESSTETGVANDLLVALWRGINVGKAKRIRMAELRDLLSSLGHTRVRTLLNSGNAVFAASSSWAAAPREEALLAAQQEIERAVSSQLKVSSRVTLLPADRFLEVVAEQPFRSPSMARAIEANPAQLVAFFFAGPQVAADLELLSPAHGTDELFALGQHAAYCWLPRGQAQGDLPKRLARIAGDRITARNWATVRRIASLLE